jgi:hypothetical protein
MLTWIFAGNFDIVVKEERERGSNFEAAFEPLRLSDNI